MIQDKEDDHEHNEAFKEPATDFSKTLFDGSAQVMRNTKIEVSACKGNTNEFDQKINSKIQNITKKIEQINGVKGNKICSEKEMFELGVYKSFPKKLDIVTDIVKIMKDNLRHFQEEFGLFIQSIPLYKSNPQRTHYEAPTKTF
jgi:hypothetical protein